MKKILAVICLLVTHGYSIADSSKTIESIEKQQAYEKVISDLEKFENQFTDFAQERELNCIKAFGHKEFCACVFNEMPIAWSFSQYIAITTKPKEKLGYNKFDKEYKEVFDKVRPIRNKCVDKLKF